MVLDAQLTSKPSVNHADSTPTPESSTPPQVQLVKATTLHHLEEQGEFIGIMYVQPMSNPYPGSSTLVHSATTQLPPLQPEDIIPHDYHEFMDIFSESLAQELLPHQDYDHSLVDLTPS